MLIDSRGFDCVCVSIHGRASKHKRVWAFMSFMVHSDHAHMAQAHVEGVDITMRTRAEVVIGLISSDACD